MKKRSMVLLAATMMCGLAFGGAAQAAVAESDVTAAYDAAVNLEGNQDGLDVTVSEVISIAGKDTSDKKDIKIQTSGMQTEDKLQAAIDVTTTEGDKNQYYDNGYFYSNQTGNNMKYSMTQDIMKDLLNYYVYLDLNSSYLSELTEAANADGTTTYTFAASEETIGEYAERLLEGAQEEHKISIASIQGSMDTDANGNIMERKIEMVYTVKSGDTPQMCILNSDAVFNNVGQAVTVKLPDLSSYKDKEQNTAVTTITPESQTLYATTGINVRAQNNVTAAVLGGINAGDSMQETGYTSDGWIQISFNNATAYVSGNYVSTTKPVIVTAMSGTMYAKNQVNVRDSYSTDGAVLGVLYTGDAVETKGYTDNNWIEISYNGQTGYVYADYLTWDAPQAAASTSSNTFSGYLEGTLEDASMNNIYVVTSNGSDYTLTTGNAYMNTTDGLIVGDWVGVYYTFNGSNYEATEVDDYNNHYDSGNVMNDDNGDGGYQDQQSYGTVIADGMSQITVALDNGITLSATKDNVSISGNVYEGAYVLVDYCGDYMYDITDIE